MWGLSFSTRIEAKKVIKQRGWFFPSFRKAYQNLTRIELRAKYIHQQGHGAHSFYALYVGVINGPSVNFKTKDFGERFPSNATSTSKSWNCKWSWNWVPLHMSGNTAETASCMERCTSHMTSSYEIPHFFQCKRSSSNVRGRWAALGHHSPVIGEPNIGWGCFSLHVSHVGWLLLAFVVVYKHLPCRCT